ncbi:hypothetical protein F400_gp107 [Bacillus phage BCD7]|uniref:Uncharacterized protein n=1 Tax=Bacillus phage BCD7 TaxID=1136534 RepID=J9PVA0_9CAUD|nr:hypothetical protein F400_gp107 [Bacillus phage BCD7]AEZ50554.1 hypothetical protein BCD7_0107 [Bacillus phage BCD7]
MAETTVTPPESFFKNVLDGYLYLKKQIDAVTRAISILEEQGFKENVGEKANATPTIALRQTLAQLEARREIFDQAEVIFSVPLPPEPFLPEMVDTSTQTDL